MNLNKYGSSAVLVVVSCLTLAPPRVFANVIHLWHGMVRSVFSRVSVPAWWDIYPMTLELILNLKIALSVYVFLAEIRNASPKCVLRVKKDFAP